MPFSSKNIMHTQAKIKDAVYLFKHQCQHPFTGTLYQKLTLSDKKQLWDYTADEISLLQMVLIPDEVCIKM